MRSVCEAPLLALSVLLVVAASGCERGRHDDGKPPQPPAPVVDPTTQVEVAACAQKLPWTEPEVCLTALAARTKNATVCRAVTNLKDVNGQGLIGPVVSAACYTAAARALGDDAPCVELDTRWEREEPLRPSVAMARACAGTNVSADLSRACTAGDAARTQMAADRTREAASCRRAAASATPAAASTVAPPVAVASAPLVPPALPRAEDEAAHAPAAATAGLPPTRLVQTLPSQAGAWGYDHTNSTLSYAMGQRLKVYDTASGALLGEPAVGMHTVDFAFSPAGDRVAALLGDAKGKPIVVTTIATRVRAPHDAGARVAAAVGNAKSTAAAEVDAVLRALPPEPGQVVIEGLPPDAWILRFAWSDDGAEVFATTGPREAGQIFVGPSDGHAPFTLLTAGSWPARSTRGVLAFVRKTRARDASDELWLWPRESAAPRRVSDHFNAIGTRWSPDGRYVAAWGARDRGELFVFDTVSETVRTIAWASAAFAWSPTSDGIVMERFERDAPPDRAMGWLTFVDVKTVGAAPWIVPEPGCRLYNAQWTARGVIATHQCPKKSFEIALQVFAVSP